MMHTSNNGRNPSKSARKCVESIVDAMMLMRCNATDKSSVYPLTLAVVALLVLKSRSRAEARLCLHELEPEALFEALAGVF
jgi:hypothetical protein